MTLSQGNDCGQMKHDSAMGASRTPSEQLYGIPPEDQTTGTILESPEHRVQENLRSGARPGDRITRRFVWIARNPGNARIH